MERTYAQYCGLARSLDQVGDRWTLLIIRELLVAPARSRELQDGLPGVATNLLAQRLRQLEAERDRLQTPRRRRSAVVYELTPLGAGLEETVLALVRWGTNWMLSGLGDDTFRPRWLVVALRATLPRSPIARPAGYDRMRRPNDRGHTRSGGAARLARRSVRSASHAGREPSGYPCLATGTLTLDDLVRTETLEVTGSASSLRRALFANATVEGTPSA